MCNTTFLVLLVVVVATLVRSLPLAPPSSVARCSSLHAAVASNNDENDPQQEYLTPNQVKTLRKEASKRKARKQLATHILSSDETIPLSENTMSIIVSLLQDNELVEVRGISKEGKRFVRSDSERLAAELEMELADDRPIFLLDTKGHAAVFYCPLGDIQLRTGFQQNVWTKKPRPKRDGRGQIIKGEYE